jgi:hypothetical protein
MANLLRANLVKMCVEDLVDYILSHAVEITQRDVDAFTLIVDNNLGFLCEAVEEAAVECNITNKEIKDEVESEAM